MYFVCVDAIMKQIYCYIILFKFEGYVYHIYIDTRLQIIY